MDDKKNYKLSEDEFYRIWCKNFGLCALTAKAIEKEYGITYSRQTVWERAQKYAAEEDRMHNDLYDSAKSVIVAVMQGEETSPIKFRAANNVINTIHKFHSRKKSTPEEPEQVYKVGDNMIRF